MGRPPFDQSFKDKAVARIIPPNKELMKDVARELNIATRTLRVWRNAAYPTFARPHRTNFYRLPSKQKSAIERQIIELYCAGHTSREIAKKLAVVSATTVDVRITNYRKAQLPPGEPLPKRKRRSKPKKKRVVTLPEFLADRMHCDLIERRPDELSQVWQLWDRNSICAWLTQKHSFNKYHKASLRWLLHRFEIITPYSLWMPFRHLTLQQREDYKTIFRKKASSANFPGIMVTLTQAENVNWWMISAQTMAKHFGFLFFKEIPEAPQWIEFFERLCATCGNKVRAIMDYREPILQNIRFNQWLRRNSGHLQVFVLCDSGITDHEFSVLKVRKTKQVPK